MLVCKFNCNKKTRNKTKFQSLRSGFVFGRLELSLKI